MDTWQQVRRDIAEALETTPDTLPRHDSHEWYQLVGDLQTSHPELVQRARTVLVETAAPEPLPTHAEIASERRRAGVLASLSKWAQRRDPTQPHRTAHQPNNGPDGDRARDAGDDDRIPRPPASVAATDSAHSTPPDRPRAATAATPSGPPATQPGPPSIPIPNVAPPPLPAPLGSPPGPGTSAGGRWDGGPGERERGDRGGRAAATTNVQRPAGRRAAAGPAGRARDRAWDDCRRNGEHPGRERERQQRAHRDPAGPAAGQASGAPPTPTAATAQPPKPPSFQVGDQFTVKMLTPLAVSPAWQAIPAIAQGV